MRQASKLRCKNEDVLESLTYFLVFTITGCEWSDDCPELMIASWTSISSLALGNSNLSFSMSKAWGLFQWLGISSKNLKIVLGSRYWQSFSFGFSVLDDQVKKREGWGIWSEGVFREKKRGLRDLV